MNGVINFLKPVGMTSSDAVIIVKKILHENKVGHLGTLDPLASGVLPIAVGKCTRLFDYFLEKRKTYRAFFDFSYSTSSLDNETPIIERTEKKVTIVEVKKAAEKLIGKQMQIPPIYSAKNVKGVRAYDLAIKGKSFELEPSEIEIYAISVLSQYKENGFILDIECSSGTYIRSITRDMGNILEACGTMTALIRLKSGFFEINNSYTVDEIMSFGERALISPETILFDREKLIFTDAKEIKKIQNGVKIPIYKDDGQYLIYFDNSFYALGKVENNILANILRIND